MKGRRPIASKAFFLGDGGWNAAFTRMNQCAACELRERKIAIGALSTSPVVKALGADHYSGQFGEYGWADDFAEAALRLALVGPKAVTGRTMPFRVPRRSVRPWSNDTSVGFKLRVASRIVRLSCEQKATSLTAAAPEETLSLPAHSMEYAPVQTAATLAIRSAP
jgi:hypothetical protein